MDVDRFIWTKFPEVGEMAAEWFNNRYRSRTAPPAPAQGRRTMLTDEKKKVIREVAEKALDARIANLETWLALKPECRTEFPNGHFADISQAIALIKSLDETPPAAPALAPPSGATLLRAYALRFDYRYSVERDYKDGRIRVAIQRDLPYLYHAAFGADEDDAARAVIEIADIQNEAAGEAAKLAVSEDQWMARARSFLSEHSSDESWINAESERVAKALAKLLREAARAV